MVYLHTSPVEKRIKRPQEFVNYTENHKTNSLATIRFCLLHMLSILGAFRVIFMMPWNQELREYLCAIVSARATGCNRVEQFRSFLDRDVRSWGRS
jgi:hypothetical protein